MERADDEACAAIDKALEHWRQGDYARGEHWFLFGIDPQRPLTDNAAAAAEEEVDAAEARVVGSVVVTQTCDIIRHCSERPFVEVCPLVEVSDAQLQEVERGRRPNYGYVAGLAGRRLVADLDRVMTVEKAVVAGWERGVGCLTDEDARRLALALARKRARVAFPDDFVVFSTPLTDRLAGKHDKQSEEGKALRALREIRVRAAPSWRAEEVELHFLFLRDDGDQGSFAQRSWNSWLEDWLKRVPENGRFVVVSGVVLTLDDATARDYVESDPLDLDYLSVRAERYREEGR